MPKYSVCLEGENIPIKTDGKTEVLGFFTTRRVKASSEKEAEIIAVGTITNDASFIATVDTLAEAEPRIYMKSISKLRWWNRLGGVGYTFFPMESK